MHDDGGNLKGDGLKSALRTGDGSRDGGYESVSSVDTPDILVCVSVEQKMQ